MRLIVLTTAMMALSSAAVGAPLPPPIAPAADGQLQCYAPDVARKTCQSLAAYRQGPDGVIYNPATVLISQTPPIVMRTVTPVTIKREQVCGYVRPEDIDAAQFTVNGVAATPDQTKALRQNVATAEKGLFGREICTAYVAAGEGWTAKASIDGAPQPAMDQKVIWVSPSAGFEVKP